jgi:integrase
MRVRLFQNRRDGTFYRATWIPGVGRDVASLRTKDRADAERRGRELLAELLRGAPGPANDVVTLGALWERFHRECPTYLDNAPNTKRDASCRAQVLFGYFGEACDVRSLTAHDINTYAAKRRTGSIVTPAGRTTGPVRARSVEADLVLLNTMLAWATTVRTARGHRWLAENPLRGIRRSREQNPQRPIATWERYQRTRTAVQELGTSAQSESERNRWLKVELALVLAEGTGRRLSSIRQLRWEDFDFERGMVRWRAEADKKRREQVVPLPEQLLAEIRSLRRKLGSVGGWIFARASDGIQPMDRHRFDHWLRVAENVAGLPKLRGGLWHPYRRKWATERKHLSLKDVAAAGGWQDTETLLTCYQHPDQETLLAVMNEERKVRDGAVSQ